MGKEYRKLFGVILFEELDYYNLKMNTLKLVDYRSFKVVRTIEFSKTRNFFWFFNKRSAIVTDY